jgi:hypothetical protein|nr:MAG TPA: hypothetical protein [Caudoviricetes sp.]
MSRQIVDLPEMDGGNLSNNDLLIVRDTSAKKDKALPVSQLGQFVGNSLPSGVVFESSRQLTKDELGEDWTLESSYQELQTVELYRRYLPNHTGAVVITLGDTSWADDIELAIQVECQADGKAALYFNGDTNADYFTHLIISMGDGVGFWRSLASASVFDFGFAANVSTQMTMRCVSAPENKINFRQVFFQSNSYRDVRCCGGCLKSPNAISEILFSASGNPIMNFFAVATAKKRMGVVYRYRRK